jgi:hypothetical protein
MQYVCSTAGCHDMIQKMPFVLRWLQHVAQMLEWKSRILMLLDLIDTLLLVLLTQSDKFGSEAS